MSWHSLINDVATIINYMPASVGRGMVRLFGWCLCLDCGYKALCGLRRKYFIPFARHFKGPGVGEPLKPLNVALAMARQNILVSILIGHCFSHSQ